jgi:hypothetical protein
VLLLVLLLHEHSHELRDIDEARVLLPKAVEVEGLRWLILLAMVEARQLIQVDPTVRLRRGRKLARLEFGPEAPLHLQTMKLLS